MLISLKLFSKILAASRADKICRIKLVVEADCFAAVRAHSLHKVLAIALIVAAAVTFVIAAAIVVAIAITIALVVAIEYVFLNLTEIVVYLFNVIAENCNLVINISDCLADVGEKVDNSLEHLALSLCLIKIKAVAKTLYISTLFKNVHFVFKHLITL